MKRIFSMMLILAILTASLTACGMLGGGKSKDTPAPSQTEAAAQPEGKVVRGTINRIDNYLVLLTEKEEYQVLDFGEGVTLDDFTEGDKVEVTYTGELGSDETPAVIIAITKLS